MNKKTIRDVNVKGRRVLLRVDFNVPLDDRQTITDDTRIQASLPTIRALRDAGASLVLMSHLGRPKGKGYEKEFSLKPVADYLAKVLGAPVGFAPDCLKADALVQALRPGDILMLENTRFYKEEEGSVKKTDAMSEEEYAASKAEMKTRQQAMAEKLASYGDLYVNDAFGSAHRAHASTAVVCRYMTTSVAGLLMEKELDYLGTAIENPKRPFVAIIGGAKVSGKLEVLHSLMKKVDTILIGGGMAYTFLKALGHRVGNSLVEDDLLDTARETLKAAEQAGVTVLLPTDNVAANRFAADAETRLVGQDIEDGWMALDIGPASAAAYRDVILKARTIVWNGPMGCFEMEPFAEATMTVCRAVAESGAVSIIGGGDSVSAVNRSGLADRMSHISTGGGASLEFLEGKALPGVVALNDK
ncbi:MAG: phosphoglycerate kinase [Lentisphaeria bacterium]|nr:phosphoglycerate kinase [Lentisphaeria bacterium]